MKINISRKYSLKPRGAEAYEMIDIGVVEDERDPKIILAEFDSIVMEYVKQFNGQDLPPVKDNQPF